MAIHTANLPRIRQSAPVWQPTLGRSPLSQRRGVVNAGDATQSRIERANAIALAKANAFTSSSDRRLRATSVFIVGLASAATIIGLL